MLSEQDYVFVIYNLNFVGAKIARFIVIVVNVIHKWIKLKIILLKIISQTVIVFYANSNPSSCF
jgi:hypothetical protein